MKKCKFYPPHLLKIINNAKIVVKPPNLAAYGGGVWQCVLTF